MISWARILYGAAVSTVIAAVVLVAIRRRSPQLLTPALAAAFLGPLAWNAILHRAATPQDGFSTDIPFKPFPVSWQGNRSGLFTLATASLLLGIALRRNRADRVLGTAATTAAVAFLVDIYLY